MTESVDEVACRWIARLDREDASPEDRCAFDAWIAADSEHSAAYARHAAVWRRLLSMQRPHAESLAAGNGETRAYTRRNSPTSWLRANLRPLAAACTGVVITALVFWTLHGSSGTSQDIATEIGGYRRVVLDDGSIVELNTDTELRVSIHAADRRVTLFKGEAMFRVAKDPRRPFTVTAGDTTVKALGTVFNLRRRRDVVELLMIEGRVSVASPDTRQRVDSAQAPPVVQAGEAAVAAGSGIAVRAVSSAEVERGLAWERGMLSFDDATLGEVVAEFNRYNRRQLVVDPAIADRRIGGYFRARNLDGFVRVLETEFGVEAVHKRGEVLLRQIVSREIGE